MTERTPTTDSNDLAHQSGTSRRSGGPVDSLISRFTGLCHRTTKNHSTKPPSDTTSASLRRPTWPTPDRKPSSPGPSFLTHAEEKEKYRNRPRSPVVRGAIVHVNTVQSQALQRSLLRQHPLPRNSPKPIPMQSIHVEV